MVRWLALALILLSGCTHLKDKGISVKCKCSWDPTAYIQKPPPKDHTP